jgi:hypothetical protein
MYASLGVALGLVADVSAHASTGRHRVVLVCWG